MSYPVDEPAFQVRLAKLAATLGVNLVAAYVVPLQAEPLQYENKYVFFRSDGTMDHSYLKHRPVPGEPAVRGESEMPRVVIEGGMAVGGAICFDYDFPRLALANAAQQLDLVALPSSDWRGIDPIHTEMATLRAIEGGYSVLRSTRFGLSAGIDPWGRIRGWNSHWDNERRVLLVELPRRGLSTIYARFGDWFPLAAILASLALLGLALRWPRAPLHT
jgi:apolipoprotein N-acyltransferase